MEIKDRVLVVEDDKRISNFIKTVLEANNYDVIVAQTGAEAYSMVTSQCPDGGDPGSRSSGYGRHEDPAGRAGMVRDAGDRCVGEKPMREIRWRHWILEPTITSRNLSEHPSFSRGSALRSATQGLGSRISRADRREF